MSKVLSTGYQLKTNGSIVPVDLTNMSRWISGRVRWKGIDTELTDRTSNNSSTNFCSIPGVPSGYTFYNHESSHQVRVTNTSPSNVAVVRIGVYWGTGPFSWGGVQYINPGETITLYQWIGAGGVDYSYNTAIGALDTISGTTSINYYYLTIITVSKKTVKTTNPRITIGGYTYNHVGTLDADVESGWYNIASGFTAGQINNALNYFDSSSRAYVDVEYTVEPKLPLNTISLPLFGSRTTSHDVSFIFKLDEDTENSASKYHARIRFDDFSTMLSPDVYESKDDQDNWYYWDGNNWTALPSAGVDPGTTVKYIGTLELGQYYWDTASWDGYGYGYVGSAYKFKIVLTVLDPYILNIGGDIYEGNYNALELSVIETSNGEIGTILATIDNWDGSADADIDYGDSVTVAFRDERGNQEEFMGVVREKIPSGFNLTLIAILGDGILAERIVKEDYTKQDVGLIAKAIIDTYCAPLTSDNIDTSTGFEAPIPADGKKALTIFENIRKNYGLYYYVDVDWDVHLYSPDDIIETPSVEIRYGRKPALNPPDPYVEVVVTEISNLSILGITTSRIDLSWTNPSNTYYTGTVVFTSNTEDLTDKTYEYCLANATQVYYGIDDEYSDTEVDTEEENYYAIFTKYIANAQAYWSDGTFDYLGITIFVDDYWQGGDSNWNAAIGRANTALAALGGGTMIFSDTDYLVTKNGSLESNICYKGYGDCRWYPDEVAMYNYLFIASGKTNIEFDNIHIDQRDETANWGDPALPVDFPVSDISFASADNSINSAAGKLGRWHIGDSFTISGANVTGNNGTVTVTSATASKLICTGVTFSNGTESGSPTTLRFTGLSYKGAIMLYFSFSDNINIHDCLFHPYGIVPIYNDAWESATEATQLFQFKNNDVYWQRKYDAWCDVSIVHIQTKRLEFSGNYIESVTSGFTYHKARTGLESHMPDGYVTNNTFKGTEVGMLNVPWPSHWITYDSGYSGNLLINQNTMIDIGAIAIELWLGLKANGRNMKNVTIEDNIFGMYLKNNPNSFPAEGVVFYRGGAYTAEAYDIIIRRNEINFTYDTGFCANLTAVKSTYYLLMWGENTGAFNLNIQNTLRRISIYDNIVRQFPYGLLNLYRRSGGGVNVHEDILFYNNESYDSHYAIPVDHLTQSDYCFTYGEVDTFSITGNDIDNTNIALIGQEEDLGNATNKTYNTNDFTP